MTECVSGLVEGQVGGNQGADGRHTSISVHKLASRSSHLGIGGPRELCEHPGDLHDTENESNLYRSENEDHNTAVAVWIPPRLHPQGAREHRLTSDAQLVQADCAGW